MKAVRPAGQVIQKATYGRIAMSRTERLQQIVDITHSVQRDLHWNTWKERYPGAAKLALPKIRDILDEEAKHRCPRGHRSSSLPGTTAPHPTLARSRAR
jgi:hypothetical protein